MIDKFELNTIWSSFSSLLFIETNSDGDYSHEIKRHLLLWKKKFMTNLCRILKSRDITLLIEIYIVNYVFSSSHVWMGELDHKEA